MTTLNSEEASESGTTLNISKLFRSEAIFRKEMLEMLDVATNPILDSRATNNKNMLLLASVVLAALSTKFATIGEGVPTPLSGVQLKLQETATIVAIVCLPIFFAVGYSQDLFRCWQSWKLKQSALKSEMADKLYSYSPKLESLARQQADLEKSSMEVLSEAMVVSEEYPKLKLLESALHANIQKAIESWENAPRQTGLVQGFRTVPSPRPFIVGAVERALQEAGGWLNEETADEFRLEAISQLSDVLSDAERSRSWQETLRSLTSRLYKKPDFRDRAAEITNESSNLSVESRILTTKRVDELFSSIQYVQRITTLAFIWDIVVPFLLFGLAMTLYVLAEIS